MADRDDLEELCAASGIAREYHQIDGAHRVVPERTLRTLLAAMHMEAAQGADLGRALDGFEAQSWRRVLPPVRVLRAGEAGSVALTLPAAAAGRRLEWRLTLEDGTRLGGQVMPEELRQSDERSVDSVVCRRYVLPLPAVEQTGYHRLEIEALADAPERLAGMPLIVAPQRCHLPPAIEAGGRIWGPAVQVYALRSQRNWGMGDFTDLLRLVELCSQAGAGIVGVNPLHALFPHDPAQASPYSPSSRLFLNTLYIDVEAVPDFAESEAIRAVVGEASFQDRLRRLRATDLVDYPGVAAAKTAVLRQCYEHCRVRHLASATQRAAEFRRFQARHGAALRGHALFEVLQEHFHAADPGVWGWPAWPQAFREPTAPAVAAFARSHASEVEFREYLQWQADIQLAAVGRRARQVGLAAGVYQDLAVGISPAGAEAWSSRDLYALGVHVGAPPDDFNAHGQDWGLPPLVPHRLTQSGYEIFIATLRAGMRCGGALRIDHVMGLMRLFWVPRGDSAAQGAYVGYPLSDLLGILALESQRNRCMVIGEDLGTTPAGLRPALEQAGVLSYRVLIFERGWDGAFRPPQEYARQALVCVSTHDLPTLRGYWLGRDIDARDALGQFPSEAMRESQRAGRGKDRIRLLEALRREAVLPEPPPAGEPADMTQGLALAVHRYLARSPSMVMTVQMEDVLGAADQVNLPGSDERHPNWRRKLPLEIERWPHSARVRDLFGMLRTERGR